MISERTGGRGRRHYRQMLFSILFSDTWVYQVKSRWYMKYDSIRAVRYLIPNTALCPDACGRITEGEQTCHVMNLFCPNYFPLMKIFRDSSSKLSGHRAVLFSMVCIKYPILVSAMQCPADELARMPALALDELART